MYVHVFLFNSALKRILAYLHLQEAIFLYSSNMLQYKRFNIELM